MCSAITLRTAEDTRQTKRQALLPSRALPPYPNPIDQTALSSGSADEPGARGSGRRVNAAPGEVVRIGQWSSATLPMRVNAMLRTTYLLSVISTPLSKTAIRSSHQERHDVHRAPLHRAPENSSVNFALASAGDIPCCSDRHPPCRAGREREVFGARDVWRGAAMQVAAWHASAGSARSARRSRAIP